jgi:hypothetical protein
MNVPDLELRFLVQADVQQIVCKIVMPTVSVLDVETFAELILLVHVKLTVESTVCILLVHHYVKMLVLEHVLRVLTHADGNVDIVFPNVQVVAKQNVKSHVHLLVNIPVIWIVFTLALRSVVDVRIFAIHV